MVQKKCWKSWQVYFSGSPVVEKRNCQKHAKSKNSEGFRNWTSLQSRKNSQPITAIMVLGCCKEHDTGMWVHLATPTLPHQAGEEEGNGGRFPSKVQAVPAHKQLASRQQALDQQQPRCVCITCIARSQKKHISWTFSATHSFQEAHRDICWHSCCLGGTTMFFHTGGWTLWVSGPRRVH